ncbi:UDP-N-acetylmuramoyl-L-alanine--D-glutamate ligase [Carboxydocella sp. ULO1]|uniref:UDP-N-acetylmuramoyl-L-alanine--D-glutamate ligase n=1 Tax=Carboxydocella sp. ULO1 TaxID=1926599 RepID=UPI0009AC71F4|nr:UDP-N-acetylmuramoyl-L-alanine--D-glutamate ligase [Carboxydocella sp. ULO1]GAW28793.1 UDP-N-acetylmuramoyl-L-alanyl-D-glutamate synthetase [Carboxydocella sp. ULO1]
MDLLDKNILVVGMAKSGVAVARFAREAGARVTVCDAKSREELGEKAAELEQAGVRVVAGSYPRVSRQEYDLVVPSPGVPLTVPPVAEAMAEGIPVFSEIELASRYINQPLVAITGTNGKTTTTSLIGAMTRQAGLKPCVAGNIGQPLIAETRGDYGVYVVEVSSFQAETTVEFRPRVAVLLNVTPDHLDRHGTMENYAAAKAKILANQQPEDFAVLNYDDEWVRAMAAQTRARVIFFSRTHRLEEGVCCEEGQVVVKSGGQTTVICPASEIAIPGAHNLENALAAVGAGWALGIEAADLARTLKTFPGVPHRLEFVAEIQGVRYINDSKGTNPDAAIKALEAYEQPIVLIAGGKNKGSDFGLFARKIKEKCRALVLVGQAAPAIEAAAIEAGVSPIYRASTFAEAVHLAAAAARPGDVVLLSPACASWDMFNNYEERGELFKQLVHSLRR